MQVVSPTNYTLSVAPTEWPVSLDEAKQQCRVDSDDFNTEIQNFIQSATEYLQTVEDRQFCTATYVAKLDRFPCGADDEIRLAKSPLSSASSDVSISYVDTSGTTQTWGSTNYDVDSNSEPGRIRLGYGATWPATRDIANAVSITFRAGQTQANVPQRLKQQLLMTVSDWWWNRETSVEGGSKDSPWHSRLLWANRVKQFV